MILVGSQRSGARALADHLTNDLDNDHVSLLDLDGFMAGDLHGALDETHAISKATHCTKFLFSLSLSPPETHVATEQEFLDAIDRAGKNSASTVNPVPLSFMRRTDAAMLMRCGLGLMGRS